MLLDSLIDSVTFSIKTKKNKKRKTKKTYRTYKILGNTLTRFLKSCDGN